MEQRSFAIAQTYAGLGDKKLALDWLERSFEEDRGWLTSLRRPELDSLYQEPRFQVLLKKLGLPSTTQD